MKKKNEKEFMKIIIMELFINLLGNSIKYSKADVAPIINIKYKKIKG